MISAEPATSRIHRHDAASAIDRLGIEPSHSVLDLGCGDGHHSRAIALNRPALFVDLDVSYGQLRELARETPTPGRCSYVCGDALVLPFANESFDRVVCSLVVYLLPLEEALRELFRIVRRRGKAYVRVPMLSSGRAAGVLEPRLSARGRVYAFSHVWNGFFFSLSGRQSRSPFVRHDRWACYLPRHRFEEAARRVGFRVETLLVDYPKPRMPSIDAWLVKD
ncbi:MAG TPA: class I SAM-dependent methyltransferase [Thermoanaerobaculia bacterium]|nr:class I SAM-dependent methyltransferase [Thermoanaerobaculia bacterium]